MGTLNFFRVQNRLSASRTFALYVHHPSVAHKVNRGAFLPTLMEVKHYHVVYHPSANQIF